MMARSAGPSILRRSRHEHVDVRRHQLGEQFARDAGRAETDILMRARDLILRAVSAAALAVAYGFAQPPRVCDPRAQGAAGDGKTLDTSAIQHAIDACA